MTRRRPAPGAAPRRSVAGPGPGRGSRPAPSPAQRRPSPGRAALAGLGALLLLGGLAALALSARGGWPGPGAGTSPPTALPQVPTPAARDLDPADAAALAEALSELDRLRAAPAADHAALAAANGRLGQLALLHGEVATAEVALANARALAPADPAWAYYLGYLLDQAGRPAEALPAYEAVLALEPRNTAAWLRLAEARHALGRDGPAREALARALALDPDLARAHWLGGQIAFDAGDFRAAARAWETALARAPAAGSLHRQLAAAYGRSGEAERARAQAAAAATADDAPVPLEDERVYALRTLQRSPKVLLLRGGEAMAAGRFAEAADLFRRAAEAEAGDADARANLGAALLQLGRREEAAAALEAALRLDPGHAQAHYNLGALAWSAGRLEEAARELAAALAGPSPVPDAHLALGLVRLAQGNCPGALPELDAWLATHPEDAEAAAARAGCAATPGP